MVRAQRAASAAASGPPPAVPRRPLAWPPLHPHPGISDHPLRIGPILGRRLRAPLLQRHHARLDELEPVEELANLGPASASTSASGSARTTSGGCRRAPADHPGWHARSPRNCPARRRPGAARSTPGGCPRPARNAAGRPAGSRPAGRGRSARAATHRPGCGRDHADRPAPRSSTRHRQESPGCARPRPDRRRRRRPATRGSACRATSCELPTVGIPEPMSRNWVTPSRTANRTARRRKPRLACIISGSSGHIRMASLAISRSAGKLWKPPR